MSAGRRLRFVSAQSAMLRAVCHPATHPLPAVPDLTDRSAAGVIATRAWVEATWRHADVQEPVRHASADLAHSLDLLVEGGDSTADTIFSVALSLLAYRTRLLSRAVPFGLFAGITEIAFGSEPAVRWGEKHRAVARADGRWLAEVINTLESISPLRERLRLVASNTLVQRGDRVVLPWRTRQPDVTGTEVMETSVRLEPEVRVLVDLASSPVPYGDLLDKAQAEAPRHAGGEVRELLDVLIARRVLITCLQPPATETDALGYVLDQLERVNAHHVPEAASLIAELHRTHQLMLAHNAAAADGAPLRRDLREVMAPHSTTQQPVAIDTLLDADVVLPRQVAWEAERTAELLARISPEPYGTTDWSDYRDRFLAEYGPSVAVPLLELTASTGLGLPDGFHGTPTVGARQQTLTTRDTELLVAAQQAALTGSDLELDDELAVRVAVGDPDRMTPPAHLEMLFELHSASPGDLAAGQFELAVRGTRGWGYFTGGRFAALLAQQPGSRLLDTLANRPVSTAGAQRAQLSFPGLIPGGLHITRTPLISPVVISLAEHRDRSAADADRIELSDLAVLCDGQVLHLVSRSRRQVIEAGKIHPLQIECQTPAVVRFLEELSCGQAMRMVGPLGTLRPMSWGAAGRLPELPRLRAGRSVLSPAMWSLNHAGLPGPRAVSAEWEDGFSAWRAQRGIPVPDRVLLERFDVRIALDLGTPSDLALLRSQLANIESGPVHLVEGPAADAFGWSGGRATEVVTLLRSAAPPRPAPDLHAVHEPREPRAHLPGASRYLHARLYGPPQGRDDLIADHLPAVLDDLGHPLWWSRPRAGRDPHLELTLRLPDAAGAGDAVRHLGTWAGQLVEAGALREITLAPYRPHTGLWGGGALLEAAEEVAAADSAAVARHLPSRPGTDRHLLAATHLLGIVRGFFGDRETGLAWLRAQPKLSGQRLPTGAGQEAGRLIDALTPTGDTQDAPPWMVRHRALGAYGPLVRRTGVVNTDHVLNELLHLHCLRMLGPDPAAEQTARRIARGHAMAARETTSRPPSDRRPSPPDQSSRNAAKPPPR
ncbi:lantibiotic dehydratase (plasmid) [Streptomyces sp. AM 4-1-1]|uniref:lantibiotic dehydratase n=1 Tax=Streptomyces sp. AM 4-1-1 TaxID=3028710 RepID=UPI0023B999FD|nr:lantibiotic dehydratase [Streptomyces sp. AM 4-1-1]WEH37879.1 lantibiotic dehydratase [Streptomyces sp. AM 4-1-1]